jgi:uncharacterized protein YjbI with pentapeptide repeats
MTPAALSTIAIAALLVLWMVPKLQVLNYKRRFLELSAADMLAGENNFRATLAQILGGAAVLTGLYYTAETFRLQQDGQITDRINKAVDQLGSDQIDTSLGGIYELARIADDSDRDHWPVMQILTAYVERHAPLPVMQAGTNRCDPSDSYDASQTPEYRVQAVANVLRARNSSKELADQHLSVVHTVLRRIDLSHADLRGAMFIGDDLVGGVLVGTTFGNGSRLSFSLLNYANLSGSHLDHAQLQNTCLVRAQLTGTDFSFSNLEHADLRNIVEADGTDFTAAAMDNADLRWADLRKVKGLTSEQIEKATADCTTQLPTSLSALQSSLKCQE